ncbi:DUF4198 domain-containing protein [Campylobacter geochelonis]|uniref:Nickel uptake substrate-specific transmembrane region n=1 Tax=Campylobacter geochelonis TaxID=1780362 RepID=A0A128ELK1_9BACT|nr:DUF4198 domain-containing protein [Campylobacter geochelonis]QKF71386.1 DUF4198 domain-containing protein [Campylobacter geochelonis]CZE48141.1 Nickel uptake substrate-specific transmembrane region [Campylobacter geochelonis]CZE49133.1 Nickel uptake substrate-specific transmembrane region [Campylobacter geochelonis]CZE51475.1 Nickel uptake substrate-specific transmembrane region [Campylobacter geochelonis]
MKLLSPFIVAYLLTSSLFAHQIIAEKKDNHYEIAFWAHDGFNKYDKKQLMSAKAYDINAKPILSGIDFSKDTPQILTDGKVAVVTAVFDALYWTQTDKGYENISQDEFKGVVFDSLRSIKLGKTYFAYSEKLSKPLGLELEVTPLINPLTIKVGEKLPVLVTYQGKVLSGAEFETKDGELDGVKTDEFGIAFVPIKSSGLQIIAAVHTYPYIFDRLSQNITVQSSISFEVK